MFSLQGSLPPCSRYGSEQASKSRNSGSAAATTRPRSTSYANCFLPAFGETSSSQPWSMPARCLHGGGFYLDSELSGDAARKRGRRARHRSTPTWIIRCSRECFLVCYVWFYQRSFRKANYLQRVSVYCCALVLVYAGTRDPQTLLWLGPVWPFFGTGYFTGFGILTAECSPRASAPRTGSLTTWGVL